jgi:CRP/FNR family transcriptional regulator, cyclic AMP receptor protein
MAERFLEVLEPADAEELRALGRRRTYRPGDTLFLERDAGSEVLVVLRGRVKLACVSAAGREALLGIREPGDLLGEMAALDATVRSATATAIDEVEVLAVPGPAFLAFIEATPAAGTHLLRIFSSRLRDADLKRLEFLSQDTVGRVCARLVELAQRFGARHEEGTGTHIDVPITQEELAGWTGSSREAVVKALRTLRELGWIATGRGGITVLDVDALRRRAV